MTDLKCTDFFFKELPREYEVRVQACFILLTVTEIERKIYLLTEIAQSSRNFILKISLSQEFHIRAYEVLIFR